MKEFPVVTGEHCFIELVKAWILYKTDVSMPDAYLTGACMELDLFYECKKRSETDILPVVSIYQESDLAGMAAYLGITSMWHHPSDPEQAWEQVRDAISQGEVPIVWGVGSMLPNVTHHVPATYLAVHSCHPETEQVGIASVNYNGTIPLDLLKKMRNEVGEFGRPKNSWLQLQLGELPSVTAETLLHILYSKNIKDKQLDRTLYDKLNRFAQDLENLNSLSAVLVKVLAKNLNEQMYLPTAPLANRKAFCQVFIELHQMGIVSEALVQAYEAICQEWEIVSMLISRASMGQPKEMITRVIDRLRKLALQERDAAERLAEEMMVITNATNI